MPGKDRRKHALMCCTTLLEARLALAPELVQSVFGDQGSEAHVHSSAFQQASMQLLEGRQGDDLLETFLMWIAQSQLAPCLQGWRASFSCTGHRPLHVATRVFMYAEAETTARDTRHLT